MRQWTKFRRMGRLSLVPLLLALILTLTIAACGGDDDTPGTHRSAGSPGYRASGGDYGAHHRPGG